MSEPAVTDRATMDTAFARGAGGAWIERDVVEAVGSDAADYLQGQLSQNVETLADGQSRWTLLLAPQGKVDAHLRLTRVGSDRFWLDVEAGHGEAALARLLRFKLRVDCELTMSTRSTLAVRGPQAASGPASLGLQPTADAMVLDALWPGVEGFDIVGQDPGDGPGDGGAVTMGPASFLDALRIRLGVPAMGAELDGSTIPAAAGIVDDAVDFTKGCYVGQELVARIDSRGSNTPTHLRRVRIEGSVIEGSVIEGSVTEGSERAVGDGGSGPEVGAALVIDGNEVGTLTSVSETVDGGWDALAYVKRAVEVPARASVSGVDGTTRGAELSALRSP